jgi:glycosyltransferase involved in cell wall biosynthesis
VSERLRRYNGVDSEVLYPPVFQPERFHNAGYGDEIVYICRLEHHKRQHLLIDAMAHTLTPVRLRLCGTGSADYGNALRAQVAALGLGSRVVVEDRWISEEEKVVFLSTCLAAAYIPLDEDSYGYPSVEASHASKAVLTTTESGGVLELVTDGVNGLVVPPDAAAMGAALDRLYSDRALAERLGVAAQARLDELNISWAHVLDRILA